MTGAQLRVARSIAALAIAIVVGGCAVGRVVQSTPDDLTIWSDTPLPPDPKLAALVLGGKSACSVADDPGPIQILVQDRRTPTAAAFLFSTAKSFGSCLVTTDAGSGGGGPPVEAMEGEISIDDRGAGDLGNGKASELGGRVIPNAAQVIVELTDGRRVLASQANGWWLAWWPDLTAATRVVAYDGANAVIASINVAPIVNAP